MKSLETSLDSDNIGCELNPTNTHTTTGLNLEDDEWLEVVVWNGLRKWHVIFLSIGAVLSFVILLCCCFKFRIPRTKQEIEGDYVRRRIMRKFRKRLKAIQNQELDEMDLKKALDKIRTELKSDTESLQQSDVLSGATLSSVGGGGVPTYRRASQIQIDISLEDLRIQSLGLGARIAIALGRFFGRGGATRGDGGSAGVENVELGESGTDHPRTALIPPKKDGDDEEGSATRANKKCKKAKDLKGSGSEGGGKKQDDKKMEVFVVEKEGDKKGGKKKPGDGK